MMTLALRLVRLFFSRLHQNSFCQPSLSAGAVAEPPILLARRRRAFLQDSPTPGGSLRFAHRGLISFNASGVQASSPKGPLGFFAVADFRQHAGDETKQLVERVESHGLVRCNMFDFPLDPSRINIRLRSKLDNERRLVLPSTHQERTIVGRAL